MKPQTENGYIQIACGRPNNDILLALAGANLSGTELSICLVVIRKTWGWKKKEDWISISQFVAITKRSRRTVIYAVSSLVQKNILVQKIALGVSTSYSFNKNFSSWVVQEIAPVQKPALVQEIAPVQKPALVQKIAQTSAKNCTPLVQKIAPTKETITKETITKEKKSVKEKLSLTTLSHAHFEDIANRYQVPVSFVLSKHDDMVNYCQSTGKQYKDYLAALRNWVKKDSIALRKEHDDRSKIAFIEG